MASRSPGELKEYLVKLYNLPVSHVHTTIYNGKKRNFTLELSARNAMTRRRPSC